MNKNDDALIDDRDLIQDELDDIKGEVVVNDTIEKKAADSDEDAEKKVTDSDEDAEKKAADSDEDAAIKEEEDNESSGIADDENSDTGPSQGFGESLSKILNQQVEKDVW